MRQAIHILKKDVRYLWIEILLVLAANGLFAFIYTNQGFWHTKAQLPQTVAAFFISFLLPVSWWLLIVRAIHGEILTGDREFWSTRPYRWQSLLAAKLLFILLFINLPIFAAQAGILVAHGFGLRAELPGLLWNQVLLTAMCFLPVAAVGTLTTGLVQFLLIGLIVWAALMLVSLRFSLVAAAMTGGGWGPMEWIPTTYTLIILAVAAPALLFWQYARRWTLVARIAAGAVVIVVCLGAPLSWTQAFAVQSRMSRQPSAGASVRAGWSTNLQWMTRALVRAGRSVELNIPLQLTGMADDLSAKPEGLGFSIEAPGGATWRSAPASLRNVSATGLLISLRSSIDPAFYRAFKDQPVTIRGDIYLTLYGNRRESKVPIHGATTPVPAMGQCTATGGPPATYFLSCEAGMRPRAAKVAVTFEPHPRVQTDFGFRFPPSYSPFPAELSISPLSHAEAYSTYQGPLDAVTITSEEPVAYVRAPLLIEGLRLGSYESVMK